MSDYKIALMRELADLDAMIHVEDWRTICGTLRNAASELERLRAIIEAAPHESECIAESEVFGSDCTCWKKDALT